jgi:protein-disulfide isomerase
MYRNSWKTLVIAMAIAIAPLSVAGGALAADTYQGIPAGLTEDGAAYLGDPNAPVVLEEWSDFLCPYCGRHFQQTLPALIEDYVSAGKLRLVFRDMPIAALHPTAIDGHVAARCVAAQGGGRFWEMHHRLFGEQRRWQNMQDTSGFLTEAARQTGVDMQVYRQCLASGRARAQVDESIAEGRALGFQGTPSFRFIDRPSGEAYPLVGALPLAAFARHAEALIAGEKPPQDPARKPPEMPLWAQPEGLAPDPDRPGYTLAGDQYKGDPKARLVVIEFTDFECSHCRRHALEVQPEIDVKYVDDGRVRWVLKHFPLRIHEHAVLAAVAAECAADQGRFWEMHDLLYEKSDQWAAEGAEAALLGMATDLGLVTARFESCFNSRQALQRVLQDIYDAQGVVTRAPSFILISSAGATMLRGAIAADRFATALDNMLQRAASTGQASNLSREP